ncbi:MAG TPA: glycosyltransferase 87 family protein, partial [Polyangia bacterium]|nr:glycosyltransferase 87 family protein [Polyangia bacterium]
MVSLLDRRTKFLLLVGFMVVCLASLAAIPVLDPWGIDMHNIHVFQQCSGGQSPYLVNAKVCGDKLARPFFYPPFLFAFFRWVRPLSLATTMRIWTVFLIVAFAGIFRIWNRQIVRAPEQGARHETVVFCVLLLVQYPFVFALERGNTDTINVLFYTLAAFLFVRRRIWLAGMAAGLAAGFKLSPIIAVMTLTGGLLVARAQAGRWAWLRFGGGALTAF